MPFLKPDELVNELINYSLELGITRAGVIRAGDIIVREEVVSAGCAGCPEYGHNLMCPPSIPPPDKFREMLASYSKGILLQLEATLRPDPAGNGYSEAFIHAGRLHSMVCRIERRGREMGFVRARGFIGGCCRLCGSCPGPGERCRHPETARSSMEANGISVVETCAGAGWPLEFPVKDRVTWTGLVLLD
ncbi:MAG: DUF2284 domain-containing protein [Pelotomaculum sp.]|nr:DUF2284 domain-containing protein [Pelotomaculum sp.]